MARCDIEETGAPCEVLLAAVRHDQSGDHHGAADIEAELRQSQHDVGQVRVAELLVEPEVPACDGGVRRGGYKEHDEAW
jgi:hypothetical protein